MPPDRGRPFLRVVGAPQALPQAPEEPSYEGTGPLSTNHSPIARMRLANIGSKIVRSLVETDSRSAITLPNGVRDTEAALALHTLSQQQRGEQLFSFDALHLLDLWSKENRPPHSHRRTYAVELFHDSTCGKNAFGAERALGRMSIEPGMRLEPGDPVEVALVLGAHVIRHNGDTRAQHLELRTASPKITLSYLRVRGELIIKERDPQSRHDQLFTAASPAPRPPQVNLFDIVRGALGWIGKRGA